MQKFKTIFLILILFNITSIQVTSQDKDCINKDCFINPLILPLNLSAGFGEVRPRHFHAGLDIRTNQKTGFEVRSIADGYISRIAVKIGGYGNVIYITHPNGYTSVYAHLQSFNKTLAKYVRAQQYKRKRFSVDIYPKKNKLKVKKGETIALSGNTGSSGGPHLHFEIRDKHKAYMAVNPLLLGYSTNDNIAPTITKLILYKANEETNIDNNSDSEYKIINVIPQAQNKNHFQLESKQPIEINGPITLGLAAFDMPNASSLKTAPYAIELLVDSKNIFKVKFDKISYYLQNMANSYLDYALYIKNKLVVHKSFLDKGNKLDNYVNVHNKGILDFNDNQIHNIEYIVKDFANNTSVLNFNIRNNKNLSKNAIKKKEGDLIVYNHPHSINKEDVKISFSKNSFFNDVIITYNKATAPDKALSDLHVIGSNLIPLQKSYKLSIKPTKKLMHPDKALIVNKNGASLGGSYNNGYVTTHVSSFGSFYISEDTIAPTIIPSSVNHQGKINDPNSISFRISDNLSGIKSFNGYINDQWVLFEYEPKKKIISYYWDEHAPKTGVLNLKLIVIDNKNNTATYEEQLQRP